MSHQPPKESKKKPRLTAKEKKLRSSKKSTPTMSPRFIKH